MHGWRNINPWAGTDRQTDALRRTSGTSFSPENQTANRFIPEEKLSHSLSTRVDRQMFFHLIYEAARPSPGNTRLGGKNKNLPWKPKRRLFALTVNPDLNKSTRSPGIVPNNGEELCWQDRKTRGKEIP